MSENFIKNINQSWTLFLDRDGVINVELPGDYVKTWDEFVFCSNALKALEKFNITFGTIVVVSNQRGVTKGVMSIDDLNNVHSNMLKEISISNGRIDKIYFSTAMHDDDPTRKPNIGMALMAKSDFSHIDFNKSIMVGNKMSDMEFGKNAGMKTVMVDEAKKYASSQHEQIDIRVDSMYEFSKML